MELWSEIRRNKMLVTELARCEFIDKRENVLLVGNPGTGKSHLATALAAAACQRGYKVRFFRATELVTTLHRGTRRAQLPATQDPTREARPARPR
jgi:DNA replication protein DnaC